MSVYKELDPMIEHRTQFAFKGKREPLAAVKTPDTAYPGQHFIPLKLRLILTLHQQIRHVVLQTTLGGH